MSLSADYAKITEGVQRLIGAHAGMDAGADLIASATDRAGAVSALGRTAGRLDPPLASQSPRKAAEAVFGGGGE